MNIREKIIAAAHPYCIDRNIIDVRIGLGYTAVQLDNGRVGVAYTFHRDIQGGCDVLKGKGTLAGTKASDMVSVLDSGDKIEAALALATINAGVNAGNDPVIAGDVLEEIRIDATDHIGMVGNFAPMVGMLRKKCKRLFIFEKVEFPTGNILPEKEIPHLLPKCQVAIISSTTIINGTIDGILDAASLCREVVMLGASTPLLPKAFSDTPATLLSGVYVTNPAEMLAIVSQGGGMRSFKQFIRKVNRHVLQ